MTDASGHVGIETPAWGPPDGPVGGLLAQTGAAAGQTRYFQAFYRDEPTLNCGTGLNTTNAVALNLMP